MHLPGFFPLGFMCFSNRWLDVFHVKIVSRDLFIASGAVITCTADLLILLHVSLMLFSVISNFSVPSVWTFSGLSYRLLVLSLYVP